MSHGYAQTIPQLLAQLARLGYGESMLVDVRRAYELSNHLFGTMQRGSGKPFTAHLLGTASILATHGAKAELVFAGLLHAAYTEGCWEDGRTGAAVSRRETVRSVLGEDAETMVRRYTDFEWRQSGVVSAYARQFANGNGPDDDLVFMRLANELEEYLDGGNQLSVDFERRRMFAEIYGAAMLEMADATGIGKLGAELGRAIAADKQAASCTVTGLSEISNEPVTRHAERLSNTQSLLEHVQAHSVQRPDAAAIESSDGLIGWQALLPRVAGLVEAILASDCGDRPVAAVVSQENMPLVFLAAFATGHVLAPLALDYPLPRRRRILESLAPGLVLTDGATSGSTQGHTARELNIAEVGASDARVLRPVRRDLSAPALIIFTSGSTGDPLGVVHSEAALLAMAQRSVRALGIDSRDRLLLTSGGIHISGITDILRSFVSGATLVTCDASALGADALVETVSGRRVTVLHMTPSLAAAVTDTDPEPDSFRTVRLAHLGGEALAIGAVDSLRRVLPDAAIIVNQLGCTEMSGFCQRFIERKDRFDADVLPAGYPVDGVSVQIVNRHGQPAAAGEVGRIEVSGAGLALGYWNNRNLTARVFQPAELGRPRRMITGDLGRWLPDGQLEHCGRADQQVQVRGHRVEPSEIESALMTIPDVKRAAVAITQSAQSAQSAEIVAHVVPEAGGVEVSQLSAQLRTILPAYMVPQRVMIHSALPLTASGKIDRQALTESIAPQRHGSKLASDEVPRQAPVQTTGSDLQATIAAAWQAVLGVSAVNGDDNFFQLGGDSLQAMRVVSQLARDLQADIDLRDIFDAPTPREFAVLVAGKSNVAPAKEASGMHDLESLLDEIEVLTAEQVLEALER